LKLDEAIEKYLNEENEWENESFYELDIWHTKPKKTAREI
jgi:hypothetical protein